MNSQDKSVAVTSSDSNPGLRLPPQMPAVLVRKTGQRGAWNELYIGEMERPRPRADEVLVQVEACSVNRADLLQRRGLYPPPPGASPVLGLDFAGYVVQLGSAVHDWRVGDRVFGITAGGGYGRYLTVFSDHLVAIPENLSFIESAAVAEVFFTAYLNLFHEAGLQSGESLLVHGGGSGVGSAAIQLAHATGANVVTTVGDSWKLDRCLQLGADAVVIYKEKDWPEQVRQKIPGHGVDVILDWIGAPYLGVHLNLLNNKGRLVLIGLMGGHQGEIELATVLTKRLKIIGSVLRSRSRSEKSALTSAFRKQVIPLLRKRKLQPVIDRVFPIESVEEAHQYMREESRFGKIVLSWAPVSPVSD